jgi:hypothetical protein
MKIVDVPADRAYPSGISISNTSIPSSSQAVKPADKQRRRHEYLIKRFIIFIYFLIMAYPNMPKK